MKLFNIIIKAGEVGIGLALLWHFSNILRYGSHVIAEPNRYILIAEIIGVTVIVIFATLNLIRDFKQP